MSAEEFAQDDQQIDCKRRSNWVNKFQEDAKPQREKEKKALFMISQRQCLLASGARES